jgi:hypothetical protein
VLFRKLHGETKRGSYTKSIIINHALDEGKTYVTVVFNRLSITEVLSFTENYSKYIKENLLNMHKKHFGVTPEIFEYIEKDSSYWKAS